MDYITSKIELSLLGAELYQKKGRLSMRDLINSSEMSASKIFELFQAKDAVLAYAYPVDGISILGNDRRN